MVSVRELPSSVATEDLVSMLPERGEGTGVDLEALLAWAPRRPAGARPAVGKPHAVAGPVDWQR